MIRDVFGEYQLMECLGEGAFGMVNRAVHKLSGKSVAIKRISAAKQPPAEVELLPALDHPNIIHYIDSFRPSDAFWIVVDYLPLNLSQVIGAAEQNFPESTVKAWTKMLLSALDYLHNKANIIHRDIKPSNLLLDNDGLLKVGDFGMSCQYNPNDSTQKHDHRVYTRWYRAPELLFGSRTYGPAIDLWACGCVMGELFNRSPLFPGQSDIDQLCRVVNILGTPRKAIWPGCDELPDFHKISFPDITPAPITDFIPGASCAGSRFLGLLLCYHRRIKAAEAFSHDYFTIDQPAPSRLPIKFRLPTKSKSIIAESVDFADAFENESPL